jgi:hypothetical protein
VGSARVLTGSNAVTRLGSAAMESIDEAAAGASFAGGSPAMQSSSPDTSGHGKQSSTASDTEEDDSALFYRRAEGPEVSNAYSCIDVACILESLVCYASVPAFSKSRACRAAGSA